MKNLCEEINRQNKSLHDRSEISRELKSKLVEENKLLQLRVDNLERSHSNLMKTNIRNQEDWRLESVDYSTFENDCYTNGNHDSKMSKDSGFQTVILERAVREDY